jgi:ribosomal protein L11 methyltransferase
VTPNPADLIEVSVAVDGEAAEAVSELFNRLGGGAVVEVQVGAEDGSGAPTPPRAVVKTFLPAADVEARTRVEEGLWHLGRLYPIPDASIRLLPEADWAEAWKAHYTPQRIGRRFLIVPSWWRAEGEATDRGPASGDGLDGRAATDVGPGTEDASDGADAARLRICLDPGMAFGTGLHPTTRLCLRTMESVVVPGGSFLDVGTGSGILSIGAARLGARRVVACDTDPRAVAATTANAAFNGVAVEAWSGSLEAVPTGRFDVVVANILARVICGMADALAARLAPGGALITSGILDKQAAEVRDVLVGAGLVFLSESGEKDWVAMCFTTS